MEIARPTVSVIITCHNEEIDLETTVIMAMNSDPCPLEIIVVDDASDGIIESRLSGPVFQGVQVIRSHIQQGVARSRNLGASVATGDLIVVMDSHMRLPFDWIRHVLKAHRKYPKAVFCPATMGFFDWHSPTGVLSGAGWRNEVSLEPGWRLRPDNVNLIDKCPCILGACYIFPRNIWLDLRGFNPNLYGWGGDEQDISFRAWIFGWEVRRINSFTVAHKWDRKLSGFFMNSWHHGFSAHVNAMTLLEDGVYEEYFQPYFWQVWRDLEIADRLFSQEKVIMDYREWVQSKRLLSDRDLLRKKIYKYPTHAGQRAAAEVKKQQSIDTFLKWQKDQLGSFTEQFS